MKTKNYNFTLLSVLIMLVFWSISISASAFSVTKSILVGEGIINVYKDGKNVLSTSSVATGDTIIVYASPADNASLTFLMIGENIYYSSPVLVKVASDVNIQAGFETKQVLFQETFGISESYVVQLGGGVDGGAYAGYDTPSGIAEISTINGQASNSKIHNMARNTNDQNYNPDSINNPHSTHVYLQASNMAVKFAEGKELTGENMQIKFRYLPVQSGANMYYNFVGLQVKLNNTSFTPLEYANTNDLTMKIFWNNTENTEDPESTNLTGITSVHRAPYVVFPIPENYPSISAIYITQSQQSAPYNNRGRLDDLIITADGDINGVSDQKATPTVYAVVTDTDIEFRGELKSGNRISIYSLTGSVVKATNISSDRVLVPIYDLPAGIYIASLKDTHGERYTFKVVVK